ncbi:MAG: class I SAM-dependent methyltransferase family protein [Candidatus Methanomethylicota archaeon]|uniref:Class I SAM-dependent methyltransferase family protein n=1 Tax=Thermoproteota archaeon TaxID=2056631 RepID=A0A497ESL0_9CREN|nr:MAG: class I SAM-dependent methyltransferase family protein [Candidatus Verstraetearchaeota archaeon]
MVRESIVRKAAAKVLSPEEAKLMLKGVDVIGDIAIIKVPDVLLGKSKVIAEAILREMHNVKAVFRQVSPAQSITRVRGIEWLAGEKRTETYHREHGCIFKVDIAKVYFSPRLLYERERIAKIVEESCKSRYELVLNMFAGVGCFSIILAKKTDKAIVYSVDINPYAFDYMVENVKLNKLEGKVIPILGDSKNVALSMPNKFTRVLMPLPELAYDYLSYALIALRRRGWIHYYDHIYASKDLEALQKAEEKVATKLQELGVSYEVRSKRVVRSVGPKISQVVLDIYVEKP